MMSQCDKSKCFNVRMQPATWPAQPPESPVLTKTVKCYNSFALTFCWGHRKKLLPIFTAVAIYLLDKISYLIWLLWFVLFQLWNKLKSISHFSFTLFTNTLWYLSKIVTHSDKNRVRSVWTKSQKHLNYLLLHHFSSIFCRLST